MSPLAIYRDRLSGLLLDRQGRLGGCLFVFYFVFCLLFYLIHSERKSVSFNVFLSLFNLREQLGMGRVCNT